MSIISFKDIFLSVKLGILCVACFLYVLIKKSAKTPPSAPRHIMVVQMAKLGDMVCTTPMFLAIKDTYPEAMVYVLGNTINKQVVAHNSDVTEYIVFTNIRETFNRLAREQFDCAFLAGGPDMVSTAIAFLANIPLVVAPRITGGMSTVLPITHGPNGKKIF